MTQNNILFLSANELAKRVKSGQLLSYEVVNEFYKQIELQNKTYNAIVTFDKKTALERAREADLAISKGINWGKLHGVPITIKDNYKTKGMLTTSGYLPLKNNISTEDAELVKLLLAEGAIILGKTNLSVLAMDMQADNPIFGKTNNPWDTTKTSGGSSGGCATALATGMTALSFGNDLAGSIRLPGSFCGVYGFKPTYGIVSLQGIQTDPAERVNGIRTMACGGPLARNIDDLELALSIIAQPTDNFRRLVPITNNNDTIDIKNLKIAWTDEFGGVPVEAEIKSKINGYVARLQEAGAQVTKIVPPIDFYKMWQTWGSFVGMQGGYKSSNFARSFGEFFTKKVLKDVPMHQNIVKPMSVEKYMIASNYQDSVITQLENFLDGFDAWICPVSATMAFDHHAPSKSYGTFSVYNNPLMINNKPLHYYMATQAYTTPFNLTESPVLAMPIGLSSQKLPIGIQVIGKKYSDYRLLNVGKVLTNYAEKIDYSLNSNSKN